MPPDRDGAPGPEVELAGRCVRTGRTPRVLALGAGGITEGRAMVFGLGGQTCPLPTGVGLGLGLADVRGPGGRQIDVLEHPAPLPRSVGRRPEPRMIDLLATNPGEGRRRPEVGPAGAPPRPQDPEPFVCYRG